MLPRITNLIFESSRKHVKRGDNYATLKVVSPELVETNDEHKFVLPLIGYDEVDLFMKVGSINCRVVVRIPILIFDLDLNEGVFGIREKPEIEVLGVYNRRTNKPLDNTQSIKISLVGYIVKSSKTNYLKFKEVPK